MSLWKSIRRKLETAALRLLAWGIPKLPRQSCARISVALGTLVYHLDRRGRAVALANLECAFGDSLSPQQRADAAKASYINFARVMLDLFWSPALAKPENRHWLRLVGMEAVLERSRSEKRGIMFLSVHAGHWEWGNLACGFGCGRAVVVAEPFKNPALEAIVTAAREVSGMIVIPQENSMLRMLREVKRGGCAAFLADLSVPPKQAATIVRAFGLEMSASIIHSVLAERANALIAVGFTVPRPDGSSDADVRILDVPEGSTTQEIAQACWDYYEPILRRDPGLWLWPYKHFRYKPRNAERPYPFYSNESGAFEKLRKSVATAS